MENYKKEIFQYYFKLKIKNISLKTIIKPLLYKKIFYNSLNMENCKKIYSTAFLT